MKYDFDRMPDRTNTASLKWERNYRLSPVRYDGEVNSMWVADMDFECAKPLLDAVCKRAVHPVYGYSFYDRKKVPGAIREWLLERFGWKLSYNSIFQAPGVVAAIAMLIREFTSPGEGIIIQPPVYYPFKRTIESNGRKVVENPLTYKDGSWRMDFDDLEEKASDGNTRMMILCSPHNPVGRVWTADELSKLSDICVQNGVIVVSDEIHMDIVREGVTFIPAALAGNGMNTITCTAPSKTFNMPGLSISATITENHEFAERWRKQAYGASGFGLANPFGAEAYIAAYEEGGDWLSQVNEYIDGNFRTLGRELKGIGFKIPEGTFLAWLDLREAGIEDDRAFADRLEREAGLLVDPGSIFGEEGRGFIRLNIACPRSRVISAVSAIESLL